jgi:hypothetical protein
MQLAWKSRKVKAMSDVLIVSRHPAAVAFIREESGLDDSVPVLESATAADVCGRVVYGNLPLHLAASALAVVAVEFNGEPPRGREYTLADMQQAGARLRVYQVTSKSRSTANAGLVNVAIELDDSDGEVYAEIDNFGRYVAPGETRQLAEQQAVAIDLLSGEAKR